MQTKKNVRTASEQNRQDLPTVSVRIDRMVDRADSKVRAYASANIGRAFAIHGIRVVDSQKGLFVQMPQRSFQKDGTTKYEDVFHPITAGAHSIYLERDLQGMLNRYARDEDITDVWIWAEFIGDGEYNIYIGYA